MGEKRFGYVWSRKKKGTTEQNTILLNLRQPKEIKCRVILNGVAESRLLDRTIEQFGLERIF